MMNCLLCECLLFKEMGNDQYYGKQWLTNILSNEKVDKIPYNIMLYFLINAKGA